LSNDSKVDVDIAREIVRLYLKNPTMISDVEDLVRWRLLQQRVLRQMEDVRRAVVWLVEEGLLSSQPSRGVAELYMLNGDRRKEAERFAASGIVGKQRPQRR
jgi:hypothetical protein